jgi:hypothetical protein
MSKYWYLTAGKMKVFSLGLLILSVLAVNAHAQGILGAAGSFAVLGASTVTNVPTSTISGDVGVWSSGGANAVTGFNSSPGVGVADLQVTGGLVYAGGAIPQAAQGAASSAFTTLMGLSSIGLDLTGHDLGGATLGAGVYNFTSSAQLTGALTLNFGGLSNQTIVIDIGSTLTTASGSSVTIVGGDATDSVYWVVGSSATLGSTTSFMGNIISLASDTLVTGAKDTCGSVIALTGAVTLDSNTISKGCNSANGTTTGLGPGTATGVPEGGSTLLYLCSFLLPLGAMRAFRFRRSI